MKIQFESPKILLGLFGIDRERAQCFLRARGFVLSWLLEAAFMKPPMRRA